MQTLLVAAHHGSRNSNSEEFLDALRPGHCFQLRL